MDGSIATQTGLHITKDGDYHQWICTMVEEKPECARTEELA